MSAPADRPLTVLIAALGGEGGGVLTDWLVAAALAADFPVQATSIPGVAQRTGATTYYVELYPATNAALGGRRPVFGLHPSPGAVDAMVASELLEAGRAMENGFVTPDRTVLVAATHRVYAVAEKVAMADGRFDAERVLRAAREMARRPILFDLTLATATRGLPLNAVLLGAVAGSGVLPLPAGHYEDAIRASGIAVEANLAGFAHGLRLARGEAAAPAAAPPPVSRAGPAPAALREEAARRFPAAAIAVAELGIDRLVDYQGPAYARLFLDRLAPLLAFDPALVAESARQLALWMAYEDVIRVADLKTRAERFAKLRAEVRAAPDEPVRVTEFLKPGVEEVAALLPPALGRRLMGWAERRDLVRRLHVPMHVTSSGVAGFLRLWLLARLRWWRPRSYRYAEEQALIERWLDAIRHAAPRDPRFAREIALCASLLKGYSDTARRGRANFLAVLDGLVTPALAAPGPLPTATLRAAREAALADPDGKALARALAAAPAERRQAAE